MKTLLTLIGIALVSLAGFAGYSLQQPNDTPDSFGAFRPSGYSGKLLTRLNSGGSESSFNTTPCTTPDGQTITANAIGDFIVITVNPGAANEEKISASTVSCSGTTLSWTIENRGLSFASATSTITANKKQHAIGETVIISNDDQFLATQYVDIDGVQTIAALKTFTSGAMFSTAASSTDECTGTSEYCTKNYIDNSVNQGAATSTEALGGIVELATAIEQASSTPTTANIPYVLQAQNATSTPAYSCNSSGTIGALCTVIAKNSGKIHQLWIDLSEAFTWTALHTFSGGVTSSATTTLAGSNYLSNALVINTVPYSFPSANGIAGTVLTNNGSGVLAWGAPSHYSLVDISGADPGAGAEATTTALAIPSGFMTASSTISYSGHGTSNYNGGGCTFQLRTGTGVTLASAAATGQASNGVISDFSFSGVMQNIGTTAAQKYSSINTAIVQGTVSATDPGSTGGSVGSSAVDLSGAFSLVGVIIGASSGDCDLNGMTIEVNP